MSTHEPYEFGLWTRRTATDAYPTLLDFVVQTGEERGKRKEEKGNADQLPSVHKTYHIRQRITLFRESLR